MSSGMTDPLSLLLTSDTLFSRAVTDAVRRAERRAAREDDRAAVSLRTPPTPTRTCACGAYTPASAPCWKCGAL